MPRAGLARDRPEALFIPADKVATLATIATLNSYNSYSKTTVIVAKSVTSKTSTILAIVAKVAIAAIHSSYCSYDSKWITTREGWRTGGVPGGDVTLLSPARPEEVPGHQALEIILPFLAAKGGEEREEYYILVPPPPDSLRSSGANHSHVPPGLRWRNLPCPLTFRDSVDATSHVH